MLGSAGCGLAGAVQGFITGIIDLVLGGLGTNLAAGEFMQVGFMVVVVLLLYLWLRSNVVWLLLIFAVPFFLC